MSLRDRCREFLSQQTRNAILRQGDPVEELVAFVVSEQGRSADPKLENTLPACCYFATTEDREEFVALLRRAKPTMQVKRMP